MNITIKITHGNGTVMEVNIPVLDSAAISMPSAPVAPDEPQAASEPANLKASELVTGFGDEVPELDIQPSGKRYSSVQELVESIGPDFLAHWTNEEKRVSEDVEKEENHDQFKCTDGFYSIPPALYSDFCAAFGAPTVERELTKARLWCETNQQNRKTRRGMGRFLNAWLCRAQGEPRTPVKGRSGSLLESTNTSQVGW